LRETGFASEGELMVPAFVAAAADYLILSRLGVEAQIAFVADLAAAYNVGALDAAGLRRAAEICRRYGDLECGGPAPSI
jgi:hypothetical protein